MTRPILNVVNKTEKTSSTLYIPKYVSTTCLEHKKKSYKLPRKKYITNMKINKHKKIQFKNST